MNNIVDLVPKGGTAIPLAAPSPPDLARLAQPERKCDPAAPTVACELIAYLADRRIRGFCGTIDDQGQYLSNVYKENRSLSAHVTADYHGRFLIELIQNG